jgi:hypothetical protein
MRNRIGKKPTAADAQVLSTILNGLNLKGGGSSITIVHDLVGAMHRAAGLEAGPPAQVLKALTPTTFGFGVITSDDLPMSGTSGYTPDSPPESPSGYDDEFSAGTLDEIWTPVNCATGTVALFAADLEDGVYDLATFPGNIALQPMQDTVPTDKESNAAMIEQTVDLATNCKLVGKAAVGGQRHTNAVVECGIMISGADGFGDDNYIAISVLQNLGAGTYMGVSVAGSVGGTPFSTYFILECPYLMITKTDTDFLALASSNGKAWIHLLDAPYELGLTTGVKLRAFVYFAHDTSLVAPIGTLDFVRYFANNTPTVNG